MSKTADIGAMMRARADIDAILNKVLCLVAPVDGRPVENIDAAYDFVAARMKAARAALIQFEDAVQGGAARSGEAR